MHTAILLDGTKNPISIRLSETDAGEFKSRQKKSMSWSGSATKPARDFNYERLIAREDGAVDGQEVLLFMLPKVKAEDRVLGLRMKDLDADAQDGPVTVEQQGKILAEQFLYPEKYIEQGQAVAA